jgi:hypothetical protein
VTVRRHRAALQLVAETLAQPPQQHETNPDFRGADGRARQLKKSRVLAGRVERTTPEVDLDADLIVTPAAAGNDLIAIAKLDGVEEQAFDGYGQELRIAANQTADIARSEHNAALGGELGCLPQCRGQHVIELTIAQRCALPPRLQPRQHRQKFEHAVKRP